MKRLLHILNRAEEGVLVCAILLMAFLTIANVLARSFLNTSLASAEELNQFLIVLVCFVGLSYAARQGRHIRMTALYDQLPDKGRKAMMIFIALATAALLFVLAGYAVHYVRTVRVLGSVTPVLQAPLWTVYALAPIGLTVGGVHYALAAVRNCISDGVWLSWEVRDEHEDTEIKDGI